MEPERWEQLARLHRAALEREDSQRAAFLKEACAGDEDLRREVESLLASPTGESGPCLAAGTRLGPYEIVSPIGAGGMGQVYKARDTRLHRIVAVKVAHAKFSERFEQEARAVAALNHPLICQLYDVGPNYLVMEYIEGAPLKGPLALNKAVEYAKQILEALDAAHRQSITHRDLKPDNILVTKQGIKLLDFGLAKRSSPLKETELTQALTQQGAIVGTLNYMSPEQLQGKEADARSDLFSFGCVLYELLTGQRAFQGPSAASVIGAILECPAPSIAGIAPPALDYVLKICLAKDPEERWQSARDLKRELEWIAIAPSVVATTPAAAARRLPQRSLPWMLAAGVLALIALGALAGYYRATRPAELKPLVRLDVDLGTDVSLPSQGGTDVLLSPDGTRLAYVSQARLFTRRLDQAKAVALVGSDGATSPFFSPDGRWVAFFAGGRLKKVSVEGGGAVVLTDASSSYTGGTWDEDGTIIASLSPSSALSRIAATGGAPTPLTELAAGEATHRWPQVLPGGKAVLFTVRNAVSGFDSASIEVLTLKDRRRKTLLRGGSFGRYVASGHLVYLKNGTLFAVPFDLNDLTVRGTPVPVLESVAYSPGFGSAQLNFSAAPSGAGTLLYRSGGAMGSPRVIVQWLDHEGNAQPLLAKPGAYTRPRLSPDGLRLALELREGSNLDLGIYDWPRGTMTRLTFDAGVGSGMNPVWTPDGRYIVFEGRGGIFWTRSDGSGKPQPLTQSNNLQFPCSFTPDGKRLSWYETASAGFALWTVPLENDGTSLRGGKPEVFLQTSFDQREPMFSPDGQWLAYASNESGSYQVYVRAFPDKGGKWQVSNDGGFVPAWSPNGRELFFRSGDRRIMVASYTVKGDSFLVDQPRVWSEKRLANVGSIGLESYDIAPDGKRIAALMPVETPEAEPAQNHVTFLLNFFDELRRKVPISGN